MDSVREKRMPVLVGSTMKVRERQTMGITSGVINVTMIKRSFRKNARLLTNLYRRDNFKIFLLV